MFALQYPAYGPPEVLEIGEAPEPHAGPGQVRIRVVGASVNGIDGKIRSGSVGQGGKLPGLLGFDGAGVVDEVGEGVTGAGLGDEVFGLGERTAAEFAVLNTFLSKPESLPWAEAAAAGVAAEAAYRGLGLLGTTEGSTVLIDGGAGGVGVFAVQFAVDRGATVFATSSEGNFDFLASLGATPVRYGAEMADRVRALAPDGVDGVFDVAGKTPVEQLIGLVAEPAQVVTIANFSAAETGVRLTESPSEGDPAASLQAVVDLHRAGKLRLPVKTFPLSEAAEAHRLSQGGHVRGKLVLQVS